MALIRLLFISCALLSAVAAEAAEAVIDFVSADGPDRTCQQFRNANAALLRRDVDKAAFAICNAIDLGREVSTWLRTNMPWKERADNSFVEEIRARLERILDRIRVSRRALEGIKTSKPLFLIKPGDWVIDWDGDGTISAFEKYLLWVPKRGVDAFWARERFTSEPAYYEAQFVSPRIKIDRSDVYWAVAYCQFAEAMLNLVLAYEIDPSKASEIRLRDRTRITNVAYKNVLEGIRYSGKLRESLLKETDDDDEWIPNPRQVRTSFPLVMDEQTFATWEALLDHMDKLFRGKTLLGGSVDSREFSGVRDLSGGQCRPGEGIDVRSLFTDPIRQPSSKEGLKSRCVPATPARTMSGLAAMIAESVKRNQGRSPESLSGEWMVLRHFYWVN